MGPSFFFFFSSLTDTTFVRPESGGSFFSASSISTEPNQKQSDLMHVRSGDL